MPALLLELRQAFQNRHGFTRSANGLAEFIARWFLNPVKRLVSCLEVAKGLLRGALGDFVVLTMLGFNLGYQPLVEVNAGRDLLSLVKRFLTLGYTPITGMTRYAGVFAAQGGLSVSQVEPDFERFYRSKDSYYKFDNQAINLFSFS